MQIDTLILGAGAAGMMCAIQTGERTLVIDHAKAAGEKIRISGGGRCNFTNLDIQPENYLGQNPHFHKSALSRYTQWDFIELVGQHGIAWHEKTLGQLFCDNSAKDIIAMLLDEMAKAGASLWLQTSLADLSHADGMFTAVLESGGKRKTVQARNLVVATGGKSIPKMGATGLAYDIARQFGQTVTETRPALVPFTFPEGRFKALAGVAQPCRMHAQGPSFDEALLFTHRGLSGPAALQCSSYWTEGQPIHINLLPTAALAQHLKTVRTQIGKRNLTTELANFMPQRLVDFLKGEMDLSGNLGDLSDARIDALEQAFTAWELFPGGTEGYRTAEVTLGGVSTDGLSSKTMAAKDLPNLYFIGEAVDVTGWLGGYNFQWAWSSGWAAGQDIRAKA